jgi:hypothetical protein
MAFLKVRFEMQRAKMDRILVIASEAKQFKRPQAKNGLLRCARNDDLETPGECRRRSA